MEFIGAGLFDDGDDAAGRVAVFGGGNGSDHLHLGNRVLNWLDRFGSAHLVVTVHAVFEDADGTVALAGQVVGAETAAVSIAAAGHAGD